jgi:release factor glutamine methyltransferase
MKVPTNRIKDIVNHYVNEIVIIYGKEEATQLVLLLTEHFFGIDRLKLAIEPDFRLNESELLTIHFAVKELKHNKPVQYIIGKTEFFGRDFLVNADVLIPRPETEQMVQMTIDFISKNKSYKRILDIGTGSGCIAVSLAMELQNLSVSACDISLKALETARINAETIGAKVDFFDCDILNLKQLASLPTWDLIVSNPPYVTENDRKQMQQNVLAWEPHLALFVTDDDPLVFYRSLIQFSADHLVAGGCILFEINELFSDQIVKLFMEKRYTEISVHPDFHGKNRFISALKTV